MAYVCNIGNDYHTFHGVMCLIIYLKPLKVLVNFHGLNSVYNVYGYNDVRLQQCLYVHVLVSMILSRTCMYVYNMHNTGMVTIVYNVCLLYMLYKKNNKKKTNCKVIYVCKGFIWRISRV